jgi:uncharacterized protein YukE
MASFQVTAEELSASGGLIATSDAELSASASGVSGTTGALAGTPAAGHYGTLVDNIATAVTNCQTAVSSVGEALREAAAAYALADNSAARSLNVKGWSIAGSDNPVVVIHPVDGDPITVHALRVDHGVKGDARAVREVQELCNELEAMRPTPRVRAVPSLSAS